MSDINNGMIIYKNLSPTDQITDSYAFDALEHAIADESILNIAVTAPYGAGKSSVIKSFFERRRISKDEFLFISLASFNDPYFSDKVHKEKSIDVDEVSLENSILQQLLFSQPVHKLPWSNYFRIKNYKIQELLFTISAILLGLCALIKIGYFGKAKSFTSNLFDELGNYVPFFPKLDTLSPVLTIIILAVILYFSIKKTIEFIRKIHTIKWNCAVGEIEVDKVNSSPLNNKIDEIIYFFEVTKCKYVIFEDLDRFESKRIFIKLRELNKLVNGYKDLDHNVKFIYALNDDIFSSRDRVKFFDFIVPIIPKISRTNVSDYFLSDDSNQESICGYEKILLSRINKNVVNDLGYYIDDLRILNNIQNEFFIYCKAYYLPEQLKNFFENIEVPNEKEITEIFCLILYKNLYPEDFKKCHFGRGILYTLFDKEDKIKEFCLKEAHLETSNEDHSLSVIAQLYPDCIRKYLNSKETNLVNFLISFIARNFITKNYYTFISNIYPGELTKEDFNLVKKMKNSSEVSFNEKIDNVELVLSKISSDAWESSSIINKYILDYICKNKQEEYLKKFIKTILAHDLIKSEKQYIKLYTKDIFNEVTTPLIAEYIDWNKLYLLFDEQNFDAFWDLIKNPKVKQDPKSAFRIKLFFKKVEKKFCSESNVRQTLTHQDLMQYYGMKISDLSLINDKKQIKKIIQRNLLELNKKNIHALYPNLTSNFISYNLLKQNRDLFLCINKNINDFIENLILTNYCKLTASDVSTIILNPYVTKSNVWRLATTIEPDFIDISKVDPHQYNPKADSLNTNGIKVLIQHKKLEYNEDTTTLLKLKYNISLKQKQSSSPELDKLKKSVKNEPDPSKKASIIENYIIKNQLQNESSITEYAIRVFLYSETNIESIRFASTLINNHFDYVKSLLSKCRAEGLSTQFFSSPYVDPEKRKEMLRLVNFPERIISLYNRFPQKAKHLFKKTEHLIPNESIPDIYKHVFEKDIPKFDNNRIDYNSLRDILNNSDWGRI